MKTKERILIIRPGALGDTLMLLPSLISLKEIYEITVVGRSPGIDYLKPYIFRGIDYEASVWHRLFLQQDVNTLPVKLEPEKVVAFLADPEKIAGKNLRAWFPDTGVHLFKPFPEKSVNIHTSLYISICIKNTGIDMDPENCLKRASEMPLLAPQVGKSNKSRIVIHPGSGSKKKNYAPGFWIKLIESLRDEHLPNNLRIILLLGPAEEESLSYYRENMRGDDAEILFHPERETLLNELCSSILFIGHDSGISHLAAMLGVSVIAFFKNSSVTQWKPLGPKVDVISGINNESDLFRSLRKSAASALAAGRLNLLTQ
ncbi:MAG: glycosyltransferase family 9 protein [Deltaproteobacteria bacterium]|nr:glycosyltransferase family 9 protein [Deltaproteobacteria bacterium]